MQTPESRPPVTRPSSGFTLIELLIGVAVVALLGALAYPSYLGSIRKGRRTEAVSALSALQQAQERWRSNKPSYTQILTELNPSMPSTGATTAPGQYYALSVDAADTAGYLMTAQARSGTSQASDTACKVLRLQFYNGSIYYGGYSSFEPLAAGSQVTDTNGCWPK